MQQILDRLDELVRRGECIAAIRDDGEVGYWTVEQATATQLANRLSVEEVRRLRLVSTKTAQKF